jgi:cation:H+ antiporter
MGFAQIIPLVIPLIIALFVLVKGADVLILGAQKIGKSFGLTPFIIGVVIVGFGTSLPEIAASISAVMQGASEIVIANAVGSNITNILLVIGILAAFGGDVKIKNDLLRTELPIFFIATVHFAAIIYDGQVDKVEAMLLLGTFGAYVWYLYTESKKGNGDEKSKDNNKLELKSVGLFVVGLVAVLAGAHYTIEYTVEIASAFSVPLGLVSILAIAIGTSLPELFVSLQAIKTGETALAVGNIFGSNAFNMLVVVGLPAMISSVPLIADEVVMELGLAVLIAASAIFFVNGLAKQIMRWEGLMMLMFFGYFLVKLVDFI